jgi:hypothetical protein
MVATEVENLGNLVERSVEAHLSDQCTVSMMIACVERSPAKDIRPHDSIKVIAT